jgi:NAD(P) transhydrogenase
MGKRAAIVERKPKIIGDAQGMLKLIVDVRDEKLLGIHIVGEQASELVHNNQLVMSLPVTLRDLISNVFNYPTLAECYKLAALDCTHQLEMKNEITKKSGVIKAVLLK